PGAQVAGRVGTVHVQCPGSSSDYSGLMGLRWLLWLSFAAVLGCARTTVAPAPARAAAPRCAAGRDLGPLLVTVDDLPLTAADLHRDAAERADITDGMLAVLARHRVRAGGLVTWQRA